MATMARDFFVRTDDAMGEALEKQAKEEGRSVSNLIRLAIAQYLRDKGVVTEEPKSASQKQAGAKSATKRTK